MKPVKIIEITESATSYIDIIKYIVFAEFYESGSPKKDKISIAVAVNKNGILAREGFSVNTGVNYQKLLYKISNLSKGNNPCTDGSKQVSLMIGQTNAIKNLILYEQYKSVIERKIEAIFDSNNKYTSCRIWVETSY